MIVLSGTFHLSCEIQIFRIKAYAIILNSHTNILCLLPQPDCHAS